MNNQKGTCSGAGWGGLGRVGGIRSLLRLCFRKQLLDNAVRRFETVHSRTEIRQEGPDENQCVQIIFSQNMSLTAKV